MSTRLNERLNQLLPTITSEDFLKGKGLGNELACHIFEYPAEYELQVRDFLHTVILKRLKSDYSDLAVKHINLFETLMGYLESRNLLDKALEMGAKEGDAAALRALRGVLSPEKVVNHLAEEVDFARCNLLLVSGVGSVWPAMRAHNFLNCMHPKIDKAPLVMLYPGVFDGVSLRIFDAVPTRRDEAETRNYYRAFPLLPDIKKP
jgi:hypothetical protein